MIKPWKRYKRICFTGDLPFVQKIKTIIALSSVSKNKDEVMNEPKLIKMNLYGHANLFCVKNFI